MQFEIDRRERRKSAGRDVYATQDGRAAGGTEVLAGKIIGFGVKGKKRVKAAGTALARPILFDGYSFPTRHILHLQSISLGRCILFTIDQFPAIGTGQPPGRGPVLDRQVCDC
jgi:hypothetical protein